MEGNKIEKIIKGEILKIEEDSIAEELGIEPGDFLLKIDNKEIYDIIEYEHSIYKEFIEIEILKAEINEIWEFEIEKDEFEDLGIEFKNPVFDGVRTCRNNCVFCFVSQLPRGLRRSLYIKDEDFRLSYLYGSYTTLSNIEEKEMERIISQHLSPLYVSVHATDSEARQNLLRNETAGDILKKIERLISNDIEMNTQIVLIPEMNDGFILEKSIDDLIGFYPKLKSVTIVPVGLTRYHSEGLRIFNREECKEICEYVMKKSKGFKEKFGTNFLFLADEFFIKAGIDIPPYEYYEDFENLENGVGLLRLLLDEAEELKEKKLMYRKKKATIACGKSVHSYLEKIFKEENKIDVVPIESYFWGEHITVTGLITGSDLIKNLRNTDLGDELILNKVMLNQEGKFLDDMVIEDIEKALDIKVKMIEKLEEIYL